MSYWLMDGRAAYSVDDATVLETCDTLEECAESINDYGDDTCIVDVKLQLMIFYRGGMTNDEAKRAVLKLLAGEDNEQK